MDKTAYHVFGNCFLICFCFFFNAVLFSSNLIPLHAQTPEYIHTLSEEYNWKQTEKLFTRFLTHIVSTQIGFLRFKSIFYISLWNSRHSTVLVPKPNIKTNAVILSIVHTENFNLPHWLFQSAQLLETVSFMQCL